MVEQSRKKLYIIVGGFLAVIVLVFVIFIIVSSQNRYGDAITVTNLASYTAGKPTNRNSIDAMQRNLLLTVNLNRKKPIQGDSVKDAKVRENTFSQKLNTAHGVHNVSFIVDIPSLRQSYMAAYQWSNDGSPRYLDEYGGGVTCLAVDRLLFGDFNCVDSRIIEKGRSYYDPVEKVLPYTVQYKYTVKSYTVIQESRKVAIRVEAFVPAWANKTEVLDGYSKEIKDWLRLKQLNPDKYYFEYIY